MEIFNNERSEYEEIVAISPTWWTEYKEMDAVYRYEGWCLDVMAYFLDRTIKNLFPSQADEKSLIIYERLLKIERDARDTIDERRRVVQAYYSGTGKLSKSVIQSIVKNYGDCDCEVFWKNQSCLYINIICDDDKTFSNKRVYQIIQRRFPAHLMLIIGNILCAFFTEEDVKYNNVIYRTNFTWWDIATLDGRNRLGGTQRLDARIPPFFVFIQRINTKNSEEITFAKLYEKLYCIASPETETLIKNRIAMTWWDAKILNGEYPLDGMQKLDGEIPLFFMIAQRIAVKNSEEMPFSRLVEQFYYKVVSQAKTLLKHRVLMNWWEGRNTLDGTKKLDGTKLLNQDVPPRWFIQKNKSNIKNDEDFSVSIYVPERDKRLDGTWTLNGAIKLNSGREEL